MRMDHQPGGMQLIRWQKRNPRTIKRGVSVWSVLLTGCVVLGALGLAAQALGLAPITGPWAPAPAIIAVIGLGGPLWSGARIAAAWMAG